MTTFRKLFGRDPVVRATAPGRVCLIGDDRAGLVLTTTVPQRAVVELAPRADDRVRAWSGQTGHLIPEDYQLREELAGRGWLDHVQGVTMALVAERHVIRGFEVRIESAVPIGGGLGSGAALEVALLRALRLMSRLRMTDLELARLADRGTREVVGQQRGILDPIACSLGADGTALLVDPIALSVRRIPLPAELEVLVLDGGHPVHEHTTDSGTARARVLAAVDALVADDHGALARLFATSTCDDDRLVRLAIADRTIIAARRIGGGTSVVALARQGEGAAAGARIVAAYGGAARVVVPEA